MSHAACEATAPPRQAGRNGLFWPKVHKTDCCWLWTRARYPGTGYGAFWQDGKLRKAHRVAYELTVGPIPDGLDLMHTCDVRHCVRPDHLRPGTRAENQQDMVAKNRHRPQDGANNGNAKFTWEQVRTIRARAAAGERYQSIADAYATSPKYVSSIVRGRVWPEPAEKAEVAA